MQQILEIHEKNKEQSKSSQDETFVVHESQLPQDITEQWLDEKLQKFSGVNDGVDTVGVRG